MIVWIIIESGLIDLGNDAETQTAAAKTTFENILIGELSRNDDLWWDFQKRFECCGYANNTIPAPLATGKFCTTDALTTKPGCKETLWTTVESQIIPIASFGFIFIGMQIIVCLSSLCLGCLIHPQEPIYREDI